MIIQAAEMLVGVERVPPIKRLVNLNAIWLGIAIRHWVIFSNTNKLFLINRTSGFKHQYVTLLNMLTTGIMM